jgi:hypothetical protein
MVICQGSLTAAGCHLGNGSLFVLHWRQHQLDLAQICHRVTQDQREIVLQIQLNTGAQRCALRKEHQMLQLENALDNLAATATCLMNLHIGVVILRNDGLLLCEITHTLENEVRP